MQQCDMCHPPQLVSYRCLSAAIGQSVMALSSLCPCPHTTHHHHITLHHRAQSVVGLAAGRAGQRSQSCSSAPRPGPPRPQHRTRHGLSFSLSAPARPSPAAAPGGSRTPHSHDHTYPAVCWLASMQSPPGPSTTTIAPCKGPQLQEVWRGRGGALLEAAQPSPHLAPQRRAGRAGAGTGRTQQQPNNSGEGKSSQKHNPHNFCTPDPSQPEQGAFTGGVGEASLGFTVWGGTFSRVRRNL